MKIENAILKFSAIFVLSLLASCNNDDSFVTEPDNTDYYAPLTIHVSVDGFSDTSGTQTRVIDNDLTVEFQEGDQMGILMVSKDGTCTNFSVTYNGSKWNSGLELYKVKNAVYVAYFPYNSAIDELSGISGADDAIAAIKSKIRPLQDQRGEYAYRASDLLIGKCDVNEKTSTLSVSLTHAYSLLLLQAGKEYGIEGNKYCYPVLISDVVAYAGATYYQFYTFKNEHRLIIDNNINDDISLKCFYTIPENGKTYKWELNVGSMASGGYKILSNINKPVRDIAIGDYYYSDGNIVPGNVKNPPVEGCIGIVFHVGEGDGDSEHSGLNRSVRGYVIALNNADYDTNIGVAWGKDGIHVSSDGRKYDGWNNTNIVKSTGRIEDYPAFDKAVNYNPVAPTNTSGWFLPSLRQFDDINANKTLLNSIPIFTSFGQKSSQYNGHYWTSTGSGAYDARDIDIINIYNGQTHSRNYTFAVRPILAF